jgi:hypothetical protein
MTAGSFWTLGSSCSVYGATLSLSGNTKVTAGNDLRVAMYNDSSFASITGWQPGPDAYVQSGLLDIDSCPITAGVNLTLSADNVLLLRGTASAKLTGTLRVERLAEACCWI